ncbi:hypothetical protein [Streptomyces violaceusniger]|uniref:Uncharacterized protein n=1 Tax=Streptomyces violaceusniger TaxID=68280 RepID=A0A4D4L2Y8_STRVO|nr:hypothetical protein SVIO_029960 [Streptomyces violaceusniger]
MCGSAAWQGLRPWTPPGVDEATADGLIAVGTPVRRMTARTPAHIRAARAGPNSAPPLDPARRARRRRDQPTGQGPDCAICCAVVERPDGEQGIRVSTGQALVAADGGTARRRSG